MVADKIPLTLIGEGDRFVYNFKNVDINEKGLGLGGGLLSQRFFTKSMRKQTR